MYCFRIIYIYIRVWCNIYACPKLNQEQAIVPYIHGNGSPWTPLRSWQPCIFFSSSCVRANHLWCFNMGCVVPNPTNCKQEKYWAVPIWAQLHGDGIIPGAREGVGTSSENTRRILGKALLRNQEDHSLEIPFRSDAHKKSQLHLAWIEQSLAEHQRGSHPSCRV